MTETAPEYKTVDPLVENLREGDFIIYDNSDMVPVLGSVYYSRRDDALLIDHPEGFSQQSLDDNSLRILSILRPLPRDVERPAVDGFYLLTFMDGMKMHATRYSHGKNKDRPVWYQVQIRSSYRALSDAALRQVTEFALIAEALPEDDERGLTHSETPHKLES